MAMRSYSFGAGRQVRYGHAMTSHIARLRVGHNASKTGPEDAAAEVVDQSIVQMM
jgi:hypothetical protein